MSGLEAFPDGLSIISPVTGYNYGSVRTSLTVLESISISKSLKLLWRMVIKPTFLPFLQNKIPNGSYLKNLLQEVV